jgi:hypothetical protein
MPVNLDCLVDFYGLPCGVLSRVVRTKVGSVYLSPSNWTASEEDEDVYMSVCRIFCIHSFSFRSRHFPHFDGDAEKIMRTWSSVTRPERNPSVFAIAIFSVKVSPKKLTKN